MPLYDLRCSRDGCDYHQVDYEKPGGAPYPACPSCGGQTERDFTGERRRYTPFPGFEFTDDDGKVHSVCDLQGIRRIEADNDRRVREGKRPFVFRVFSQNRSNMDQNTLGETPHQLTLKEVRRNLERLSRGRGLPEGLSFEELQAHTAGLSGGPGGLPPEVRERLERQRRG